MVKVKEKKTAPTKGAAPKTPKAIKGMNKHETDANDDKIYFMALGGLEHIGQNMYVYKYKGKYLVVDCGMGFLDEEIGAGDVQYCDTTWLEKRKKDVVQAQPLMHLSCMRLPLPTLVLSPCLMASRFPWPGEKSLASTAQAAAAKARCSKFSLVFIHRFKDASCLPISKPPMCPAIIHCMPARFVRIC